MGSPYFLYAGSVHVDEPTEEFLGVTLAEQCHDGSSEQYVGESTLQLSSVLNSSVYRTCALCLA